jgi:phage terminase large subunit-like protein
MMTVVNAIPGQVIDWCRSWDLGATISGDFTAGGEIGRLEDGRYITANMVRERFATNERDRLIKALPAEIHPE